MIVYKWYNHNNFFYIFIIVIYPLLNCLKFIKIKIIFLIQSIIFKKIKNNELL